MMECRRSLHERHEDRISKLPDEILISIISRLTLREATATSLLSSCWRYLHTYITRLHFPSRSRINMVNHVLDSHRGCRIQEFKVETDGERFNKCFEFALTKKAEIIHIHSYDVQFLTLNPTILLHGLQYLKELSLTWIDMTEQEFVLLLSNSLALESLSIEYPLSKLKNVSIVGHSKLKHFGLSYAFGVGSIEIRDVINLVSLKLFELSSECIVQLSNIPKLIKLDYREILRNLPHAEFFAKMSSCIRDQLQLLHLSTSNSSLGQSNRSLLVDMSVKLVNIKHLELVIHMETQPCSLLLCRLCRLIDACPSLEKLVIKFSYGKLSGMEFKDIDEEYGCFWINKLSPNYFKEIEIIGYLGSPSELKLALHVVNNARALEKLIVVPYDLNDAVREESSARAHRDFQHIRSVNVNIFGEGSC